MTRRERAFDKATIIAATPHRFQEPESAELIACEAHLGEAETLSMLEELVAEGWVERSEHSTYCSECGSDSGLEHRYRMLTDPPPDEDYMTPEEEDRQANR